MKIYHQSSPGHQENRPDRLCESIMEGLECEVVSDASVSAGCSGKIKADCHPEAQILAPKSLP
jgi:hypothetical protein